MAGLALRAGAFLFPLYDDDGIWGFATRTENPLNLCTEFHYPPPLGPWLFQLHAFVLGDGPFALRSVPVLFGLILLILVYKFACRLFDRETGYIAVFLYLFCLAPFSTGVTIDAENSVYLFLAVLCFYLLYSYMENPGGRRYRLFVGMGVLTGLLLLIKMTAFFIYPALALGLLAADKRLLPACKGMVIIVLVGARVSSLYPLMVYAYHGDLTVLQPILDSVRSNVSLFSGFRGKLHIMFIYLTPLLILLPLTEVTYPVKKKWILYIWAGTFLISNLMFIHRWIPRYYSILVPPAVLLAAAFLRRFHGGRRTWWSVFFLTAAGTAGLFCLNHYLVLQKTRQAYFQFSKSPVQYFSASLYTIMLIAGAITLLVIIMQRIRGFSGTGRAASRVRILLFPILFSVLLSFNLFFILNNFAFRDHRAAIAFFVSHAQKHDMERPVYAWNEDIPYYLGMAGFWGARQSVYGGTPDPDREFIDLEGDPGEILAMLYDQGGTAVLLNYPPCKKCGRVYPYLSRLCRKEAEFHADGYPVAQIFSASPGDARLLEGAARYYLRNRDRTRALETWERLLKENPGHQGARRMIRRLSGKDRE